MSQFHILLAVLILFTIPKPTSGMKHLMKYKWINELKRINELYEMNGQSEYYNGKYNANDNSKLIILTKNEIKDIITKNRR